MKPSLQHSTLINTLRLSAALLLAAGASGALHAAALNWGSAAAGGTGTWDANTTTNWFDGALDTVWPAAPGSGNDDAIFGGTAGTVTIAPGGVIANDLLFNVDGFVVTGDTLTFDAALTKPIIQMGPGISAAINSVVTGTNGFRKQDAGTLVLNGSNTFYGNIIMGAEANDGSGGGPACGVLRITNAAALGVRGNVVQADGSTNQQIVIRADGTRLELDGSSGDITISNHITFITSGPNGVVRNVAGNNTINSDIILTTGVNDSGYVSDGGSLTLAGAIHVGSSARSLVLLGTNSAVNTVSGVISNASNGALTGVVKKSANSWNTWMLTGSNTYGGLTVVGVSTASAAPYVTNGILRLANSSAIGTSNLVVYGGFEAGRVELTGNITITNAISLYGRQGVAYPAISSYSGTNTLTGDINVTANGSTLSFESQAGLLTISGNPLSGAAGRSLTLLGAGNGIYAKLVTTNVANEVRKFGNGTWTLTGSNNFVNSPVTANGGRFIAAHPHAFGPAGKAMSFAASSTFELATDTPVNAWQLWTSSGSLATPVVGNLVGNRATVGPALTNNLSSLALGSYSKVNFTTGANATGNGVFNFTTATLSGGIVGDVVLNPTTAQVNIAGAVTAAGAANAKNLLLDGDATVTGHSLGGAISNGTATPLSLIKQGTSGWTLAGASTYTGATTVSNGLLRVTGAISNSAVTVVGGTLSGTGYFGGAVAVAGGTLEPGVSTSLGETITINNDLTLAGTALMQIGKSGATPVNDSVTGITNINYGGTLIATNATGASFVAGDAFVLFTASGTKTGNFTNIVVAPAEPSLIASFNPTNGTLSFASAVVPQPTLNYTNTGGSLQFTWAGTFKLQSQTNALSVGLRTNWRDYPGGGTSPVSVPVSPATPSVFFRLSQ